MKCPGQDTRFWKPDAVFEVACPECGGMVEFFKDDADRKCSRCGHRFANPHMDFGCAAYCPYAEQCVGNLPPDVAAQREELLKDRVAVEVKRFFKSDFKRIGRAVKVARHAERIGRDSGGDIAVIMCAAYLHDVGGPSAVRRIMEKVQAPEGLISTVLGMIERFGQPRKDADVNFKSVFDALQIVHMAGMKNDRFVDAADLTEMMETVLLSDAGKREARAALL